MRTFASYYRMFGAAQRAASAARSLRTPAASDLRVLGIEPKAFPKMR